MSKKIIFSLFLCCSLFTVNAQNWLTDFTEAQKIATQKNQHIVLVFQGSDWCAPCIKLDTEIWSTDEFKSYAEQNFVMVKADFPRKNKNKLDDTQQQKNNELAEKYNTKGYFPYVVVLDKDATVLGSTGYKKVSPTEYIQILSSF